MVCKIHDRSLIRLSAITDFHCILIRQRICNFHFEITRKSLLFLCAEMIERNAVSGLLFYFPDHAVKSIGAAVKIILILICRDLAQLAVYHHLCLINTVTVSSDGCAKITGMAVILCRLVIAQYHIAYHAVFIRHQHGYQRCAMIRYFNYRMFLIL